MLLGGAEGCRLHAHGASIPDYDSARAIGDLEQPELAIERWRLLYQDPDFELDAMLGSPGPEGGFIPGMDSSLDEVLSRLQTNSDQTQQVVEILGLDGVWNPAHRQLEAYLTQAAALGRKIPLVEAEFLGVLARALVAHALNLQHADERQDYAWPTGGERDALVTAVFQDLGGDETYRSLLGNATSWIKDRLKRVALNLGTSKIARKRGVLSDAAYPGAGDILFYQARGEGIRNLIEEKIASAPKPLLVLAHSLGGIACVDLLASKELAGVERLVTVGSQAPLLYELNALCSLPFGHNLPKHFPKWLNIYDKRDFLSYLAAPIFLDRASDVEVDNGQPFPQSHGAYWLNSDVWKAVGETLK